MHGVFEEQGGGCEAGKMREEGRRGPRAIRRALLWASLVAQLVKNPPAM